MAPSDANIFFSALSTIYILYYVKQHHSFHCNVSLFSCSGGQISVQYDAMHRRCAVYLYLCIFVFICVFLFLFVYFQVLVEGSRCNARCGVLWSEKLTGSRKGDLRRRQNRAKSTFLITIHTTAVIIFNININDCWKETLKSDKVS